METYDMKFVCEVDRFEGRVYFGGIQVFYTYVVDFDDTTDLERLADLQAQFGDVVFKGLAGGKAFWEQEREV